MKDVDLQRRIDSLIKNGWSYGKIARNLKVSKTTIRRWHKGECKPKLLENYQWIHLWSEGLNCSKEPFVVRQKPEGIKYKFPVTINIETDGLDNAINLLEVSLSKLKEQKEKMKYPFTEDEKVILRNLPVGVNWIVRDENEHLKICAEKPKKREGFPDCCGFWAVEVASFPANKIMDFDVYSTLFQCIKWTDEHPCEFRKFI